MNRTSEEDVHHPTSQAFPQKKRYRIPSRNSLTPIDGFLVQDRVFRVVGVVRVPLFSSKPNDPGSVTFEERKAIGTDPSYTCFRRIQSIGEYVPIVLGLFVLVRSFMG